MKRSRVLVYHEGRCGLCEQWLELRARARPVRLHVLGPAGTMVLRCSLCEGCIPTPANAAATTGVLATRLLSWYRTKPDLWPTLRLSVNG
jgi:hypothetical protein